MYVYDSEPCACSRQSLFIACGFLQLLFNVPFLHGRQHIQTHDPTSGMGLSAIIWISLWLANVRWLKREKAIPSVQLNDIPSSPLFRPLLHFFLFPMSQPPKGWWLIIFRFVLRLVLLVMLIILIVFAFSGRFIIWSLSQNSSQKEHSVG